MTYPLDAPVLYPVSTAQGGDTITVLKRSVVGADRLRVQQFSTVPTSVSGCSLQPNSMDEVISDTDLTIAMWLLYTPVLPIIAGLTAIDAIQVPINGVQTVYEDFGDPALWTDLATNADHYQIKLRKARG